MKKIFLLGLILLLFVTVASVSAKDINDTLITIDDNNILSIEKEINNDSNIVSSSSDDEKLESVRISGYSFNNELEIQVENTNIPQIHNENMFLIKRGMK